MPMSIANPTQNATASPPPDEGRRSGRRLAVVVVVAIVVVLVGAAVVGAIVVWPSDDPTAPVVTFVQPVPDDVQTEARSAVAAFVERFATRRECVGGAEVLLVDEVPDGDARYLPAEAVIEIEIPTSPRRFRDSLVHELAHHVEHRCPDFATIRDEVLTLTGATAWTGQSRWAERPSELWAESVVEVVLGERVRFGRSVPLGPELVDAVGDWADSDPAGPSG
jgi:hypothetical protein